MLVTGCSRVGRPPRPGAVHTLWGPRRQARGCVQPTATSVVASVHKKKFTKKSGRKDKDNNKRYITGNKKITPNPTTLFFKDFIFAKW